MTKLVGILNITPDSFSDGNKYNTKQAALNHLEQLVLQGASTIDIGAESTRPFATPISHNEEWQRLSEILPEIINYTKQYNKANQRNIEISLDSRHYQTVDKALDLGIDIINDVGGFDQKEMVDLAVNSQKKIVVMHNLGVPADKNKIIPSNLDVIEELIAWMKKKERILLEAGVKKENIIFDPGIGFGKNADQSIYILKNIEKLRVLNIPLFIGHSKKSFLEKFFEDKSMDVAEMTLEVSRDLISKDVEYLRIHDVGEHFAIIKG
ncbi:MAG: dihydropteroate synthase [Proteobacteria bacterium]|nr:dihydropteroate synthase [Pseudomonadota bacterium]